MSNVFVYDLEGNLYINLTNACCNDCVFCIRLEHDGIGAHSLWLEHEPTAQEVIDQLPADLSAYPEVVFCGFGEPMMRLETLLEVAAHLKVLGKYVRINTNGLANLVYGRDVTPELSGLIDCLSISLNAPNATEYQAVSRSVYGEEAFDALLEFASLAKHHVPDVVFTVVDTIGEAAIAQSQALADRCGVKLRVRSFITAEQDH